MTTVDLNGDVGESFGAWSIGDDQRLIPLLTSVNVACGFHAGDPLGEYRVEVFIDGSLKTTLRLKVVAPSADSAGGRT